MKKKNQTTTTIPKYSDNLMKLLPNFVTISDLPKYKDLDTVSVQSLKDKGLDAYVNKTVFKQQPYELPKSENSEERELVKFNYVRSYGDETQLYTLEGMEGWTVKEFTEWILQQNKWHGHIEIWSDEPFEGRPDYIKFQILYDYDKDKLVDIEDYIDKNLIALDSDKYSYRTIKNVSAHVSWSDERHIQIWLEPTNNYEFSF